MSLPAAHLASSWASGPPSCHSRQLDVGTATCTPHTGSTLGAMPPYHLARISAGPRESAPAVRPSRHWGHSLRYTEDTQAPATRGPKTQPRSGTHTCTARYWVTQSHTNRFTPDTHRDRHPKTHGHSHTQVSQTRQNTQTRTTQEGTEQQAYTGTHEGMLLEK